LTALCQIPEPGQLIHLRQLRWLVEAVEEASLSADATLAQKNAIAVLLLQPSAMTWARNIANSELVCRRVGHWGPNRVVGAPRAGLSHWINY
jgi:hypothetical protein